jgi:hypothetical protein
MQQSQTPLTAAQIVARLVGQTLTLLGIKASSSAGLEIQNASGANVATFGPGGGQSTTFSDGISCAMVNSTSASGVQNQQASTQDALRILGRAGGTSSYIGTLTTAALTASRTYTLPNAAITVAGLELAQTFTAAQTVQAATGIISRQAATQDAVAIVGRAGGTSSYIGTITTAALSASVTYTLPASSITIAGSASALTSGLIPQAGAGGILADSALGTSGITGTLTLSKSGTTARTATFPDAAIVVAGSAVALTSGRVPFATTGGILTNSSLFTFSAPSFAALTVGASANAGSAFVIFDSASGYSHAFLGQVGGVNRWQMAVGDATAETGSDAGTNFSIAAYTDAGASIDTPISIVRASGGLFSTPRPFSVANTTDATTTSDGPLRTTGGASIAKSIVFGNAFKGPVRSVTSAAGTTTLDGTDWMAVSTGATTQTFTLPAAATGRQLLIKNRATGNLTINRAGADTIDGGTTLALTTNQWAILVANGTDWCVFQ